MRNSIGWLPPRLGIAEGKLVAMPRGCPPDVPFLGFGIEAAIGVESHQQAKRLIGKELCQLHGVVPSIEDKNGEILRVGATLQQLANLRGGDLVHIVGRFHPVCRERRTPTVMAKADLSQPLIRPSGDNRLASRMPIVVMIVAAFGAGFCIIFAPRRAIKRIDTFAPSNGYSATRSSMPVILIQPAERAS